jgi:hypothetical protein
MRIAGYVCAALATLVCAGCGDDGAADGSSGGNGTVSFNTWGEEYIEDQIPADVFADGWSVTYDAFLVNIAGITIADDSGAVAAEQSGTTIFDHTQPGVKPIVTFADLEAKNWTKVSYRIQPATADSTVGLANQEQKMAMVAANGAVMVEGRATKDTVTKTFAWVFTQITHYDDCKGDVAGKETAGVLVTNGGTDDVQLTIHGDHLFYDDLTSPEAKVRFQHIADADADDSGDVTLEELAAVKLTQLPPSAGPFGTGSSSSVDDLKAFVTALSGTVGHYRGEGECISSEALGAP